MVATRVGVNGFGRIGRHFLRAAIKRDSPLDIVAVNDLGNAEMLGHLLEYDSVHGRLEEDIKIGDDHLIVGDRSVRLLSEKHPSMLPWARFGVDIAVECTGWFTTRTHAGDHLVAGADRVVVSAPSNAADVVICMGVNEERLDRSHRVVSSASCTTNCVATMASVLHREFGIVSGWVTTVHAFTNDQSLVDARHHSPRRARAANQNIIPSSTGADHDLGAVIPDLGGRFQSVAVRVPVPDGSLTDLTCVLDRPVSAAAVNDAFAVAAEEGRLRGILGYTSAPIVSSDVLGDARSSVVSGVDTIVQGDQVKAFGWYDNEWGYANRLLDVVELAAGVR